MTVHFVLVCVSVMFNCAACNYTTERCDNFQRHKKGKKHIAMTKEASAMTKETGAMTKEAGAMVVNNVVWKTIQRHHIFHRTRKEVQRN